MISMKDLWDELYDSDDVTIIIKKDRVKDLKGKLSRYKYRKMKELEEEDLRLKIEIVTEDKNTATLKIALHGSESGGMLDIKIVGREEEEEENWEDVAVYNEREEEEKELAAARLEQENLRKCL